MPAKNRIRQMFDGIATDYDRLNHIMSLGVDRIWRRRALKEILSPAGRKEIADIACGTGDFSIAIARRMSPGSHITGIDISDGMLAVMRDKVRREGLSGSISCEQGDSENMRFGDGSFDVACIGFGIRNFEDRTAALKEIRRILRSGGRLVILELSVPSNPVIRGVYNIYFKNILPCIGGLVSGDRAAYRYLPASVIAFPGKEEWMRTMRGCGFTNIRHKAFTFGLCRMYVGEK